VPEPPLPTLLSQVLVAFTIEFDNEWERQMATVVPKPGFLVSLPMWANFMRFVDQDGLSIDRHVGMAYAAQEPVHSNIGGLERWGYITVQLGGLATPARTTRRDGFGTNSRLRSTTALRATAAGENARKAWAPLAQAIEDRWMDRLGPDTVKRLRRSIGAIVERLDGRLPRSLPMLAGGMRVQPLDHAAGRSGHAEDAYIREDLAALMSQGLAGFAIEFERDSDISLAIGSNVLRLLGHGGVPVGDLPRRSGLSKQAVAMSLTWLRRSAHVVVEPNPTGGRGQVVKLTPLGQQAWACDLELLAAVEQRWQERFAGGEVGQLRSSLLGLFDLGHGRARLAEGLIPPVDGWRARKPYVAQTEAFIADPGAALPHFPMILHRGGWPDGA